MQRLTRNAIRCKKCDTVIESKSVHNWVSCPCGACFVDGGLAYSRIGGDPGDWENLSEYANSPEPSREQTSETSHHTRDNDTADTPE